jgi:hypothetical protein
MAAAAFFDWRSNSAVLEIAAEHVGVTGQTMDTVVSLKRHIYVRRKVEHPHTLI